jgi:V/A-type H+-transporting ATPase subunit C
MLESVSSNATVAKIRALHGRMLTGENYREMLARRSVPEIAEYLSATVRFKDVLKDIDPMTVHRGFLETLLEKENFETYIRLCKFQQLDKLPFFDFLISRSEIGCLLMLINSINSGLDRSYLDYLPGYITKYSDLDLLELSRAESFTELVKLLRTTEYYKPLVRVRLADDGTVDYTECERRLRTQYYSNIIAEAEKAFPDSQSEEVVRMVKADIDFLNMVNAYRMKAFFGFSAEQIKAHQIKISNIGRKLDSYYALETPEQMLEWLSKNRLQGEISDSELIEVEMQRDKFRRLEHRIYRSFNAPVVLYAFTQLCDYETSNITHIIEGIRYGVDPSYIENNILIC